MMDCGKKTLIFLTLCSLAGAQTFQVIKHDLEILVSVPSTHIGDTEIASGVLSPFRPPYTFTIVAQKNQTQCINSTDLLCTSMIKEPKLNVSVSSRASNGHNFSYSESINGSKRLAIHLGSKVTLTSEIDWNGGRDKITISLTILYEKSNSLSLTYTTTPTTLYNIIGEIFVTTIVEENDGQSTLHSGPLSALILLALLPILLFK